MDVTDSVKLTEQRDGLTAKQTTPVACVSDLLKCVEELEKSATTSQGHNNNEILIKREPLVYTRARRAVHNNNNNNKKKKG